MELSELYRLLRRWLWLLILAGFLAGGVSYLVRSRQLPHYEATVMLSVGGFIQSPNPDTTEIRTGVELAQTYAVLARTYNVVEKATEEQDFPLETSELLEKISTRVISNTSLLTVSVTYTDPILAADMANEIARQLILNSPTNLTAEQQQQIDIANSEIAKLNERLVLTRAEVELLESQLEDVDNQEELVLLRAQRDTLIQQINQASANLAQFSDTVSTLQERTNSLDIVEPARIPTEPAGLGLLTTTAMSVMIGVALATVVALVIDYFDDTIKASEQATQLLGTKVVGETLRHNHSAPNTYPQQLIALEKPHSADAERYRILRANLLFSENHSQADRIFVITSVGPNEGKSVTTANLAAVFATAGQRVLVIDADMRHPTIHKLFDLDNTRGLSSLLAKSPEKVSHAIEDVCADYIQSTTVPGLSVIPSGIPPNNPAELLGAPTTRQWLEFLKVSAQADVVLCDAPPVLAVSDPGVLATSVGAPVLLVLRAGKTRCKAAEKAKADLAKLNVAIEGVILNFVEAGEIYGYYGYHNYYES